MQRHYSAGLLPTTIAIVIVGLFALLGSAIDRLCNQIAYFGMVRLWLPRRTYREARPVRFQTWAAKGLYQLSEAASRADTAFDHAVSRLLIDTWWSAEPARVTPSSRPPEVAFRGAAYWATRADTLWDRAATSVMVNMWLPEPEETMTLGTPRAAQPVGSQRGPRSVAERHGRMGALLDLWVRLVSTITVQAWLPESMTAEFSRQTVEDRHGRVPEEEVRGLSAPSAVAPAPRVKPARREDYRAAAGGLTEAFTEARQVVQGWAAGSGMTLWRAALVIMGAAVVIVVLLIALGYLRL